MKIKLKNILFISILSFFIFSCESLVEDLNDNPNRQTSSTYDLVLSGTQLGNMVLQTGEMTRKTGIFSGQYTGTDRSHLLYNNYNVTASTFNAEWNNVYADVIVNSRVAEQIAIDNNIGGITLGIIKVVRASAFGTAASLWGDIPYDESGVPEIENPAFENQIDVYNKIQLLLDEAISDLSSGIGRPSQGADLHFDGNPVSWIEVANSLKARYYLHQKDYVNALSYAEAGISSNENSFVSIHGNADASANLTYQFFEQSTRGSDVVVSDFLVSMLDDSSSSPIVGNYTGNSKSNESHRFNYFFRSSGASYIPQTINGFAQIDASSPILTYAENLLIIAESQLRLNGFDNGLAALNNYRSFLNSLFPNSYQPLNETDFQTGGIENNDNLNPTDALLKEILEEKYIMLFGTSEVFSDIRRTLSDVNSKVNLTPNTGSELPQRFLYPQSEIDRNSNAPNPIPGFFEPTQINK